MDSRQVVEGDIFVVLYNDSMNNECYVEDAIIAGAKTIISSRDLYDVETILCDDTMHYLKEYVKIHYAPIINQMNLMGVTGTNGKTTTCYLIYQLLNYLKQDCCYIGTLGFYQREFVHELDNTTPNIVELYELLLDCYDKGYRNVVMEVSSHALFYERAYGLEFNTGVFTNLSQDHLDFHHSFESYLVSKQLLKSYVTGTMVVNYDDAHYESFVTNRTCSIGYKGNDLKIMHYDTHKDYTVITLEYKGNRYVVQSKLKAKFNVYNLVMAIGVVLQQGICMEDIIKYCNKITMAKGRCQIIPYKCHDIVVDYAHTPDAVEKVIDSFREVSKHKIITIIGCGGDRDKTKRPLMASVACCKSDVVIFTSDNPRTEDPECIIEDMVEGLNATNYIIEIDRKEAIYKGIMMLEQEDTLLILGKGHEDYQIINTTKHHFDDVLVVYEIIH